MEDRKELVRWYSVTVCYWATTLSGTERRDWTHVAAEVTQDHAIHAALARFREEEVRAGEASSRDLLVVKAREVRALDDQATENHGEPEETLGDELYRPYAVTIRYLESVHLGRHHGPRRSCEWTTVAEEISEDDAIWTALREFRREEMTTWKGWPRDVISVAVEVEPER